jgi:hypothetical protein
MGEEAGKVVGDDHTEAPSGTEEKAEVEPQSEGRDKVDHKTFERLLSQKKKRDEELREVRAKLEELETERQQAVEAKLKETQDFKKLAELKDEKLKELTSELTTVREQQLNARKLDRFLTTLDGKVDKKFWSHIDLDAIVVDPESGDIDEMSVSKAVEDFRTTYPEIIRSPKQGQNVPNTYPQGTGTLTYEEWLKLPAAEMRARYNEVRSSGV